MGVLFFVLLCDDRVGDALENRGGYSGRAGDRVQKHLTVEGLLREHRIARAERAF